MNAGDLGIRNLATAQQLLLAPHGLDEAKLQRVLADIFTHKIDYADLYFQYTRNEAWSLEEGIVKSGSFSIDQGVGVRAVSGDKTAFAYSDDISLAALSQAAAATRTIGRAGSGRVKVAGELASQTGRNLYTPNDPLDSMAAAEKVALLERVERAWRAPRIRAWCRSWPAWPVNTTWYWWRAAAA
ncbi:PmbA/TldA family metallopeptidase [Cupriavidus basilensis]